MRIPRSQLISQELPKSLHLTNRLMKVLSKTLSNVTKAKLKSALIALTEKHCISPNDIQSQYKIPLLVLTSSKTSRSALAFYLVKLFQQIISLKLSVK